MIEPARHDGHWIRVGSVRGFGAPYPQHWSTYTLGLQLLPEVRWLGWVPGESITT